MIIIGEKINGYWILWRNLNETDHLEDLGTEEDNLNINLKNKWFVKIVDWICLAMHKDQTRALVNMIAKFGYHKIRGIL